MQKIVSPLFFLILILSILSLTGPDVKDADETSTVVQSLKAECKQLIKPFRYESSIVAFSERSNRRGIQTLDILFQPESDYLFAFNSRGSSSDLSITIYSGSQGKTKPFQLVKLKNVNNKKVLISSKELNQLFVQKCNVQDHLKAIFIKYRFGKKSSRDVIVMVKGFLHKKYEPLSLKE